MSEKSGVVWDEMAGGNIYSVVLGLETELSLFCRSYDTVR